MRFRVRFSFLQLTLSSGYVKRVSALSLVFDFELIVGSYMVSLFERTLRLICVDSRFEFSDQFVLAIQLFE